MKTEKIKELSEDIYLIEAFNLGLISITDGFMRLAAINVDARCACTIAAGQITYVSENAGFLKLYPDPKQVSVFRMLLADGILREFRLLDSDLRQEMIEQWVRVSLKAEDKEKHESNKEKYGKIWMKCSDTAFEAMDMTLIPAPGEKSEYWNRMVAVANDLKNNNDGDEF